MDRIEIHLDVLNKGIEGLIELKELCDCKELSNDKFLTSKGVSIQEFAEICLISTNIRNHLSLLIENTIEYLKYVQNTLVNVDEHIM